MKTETAAEQLLYTTVRIETQGANPNEGCAGTSFIFGMQEQDKTFLFLVTNKHVIKGAKRGQFFFTRRKDGGPDIGNRFDVNVDNFEQRWFGHPRPEIDIAVMPLVPILEQIEKTGTSVFYKYIDASIVPTPQQIDELDALEEVVFVGYPNGIYDTVNLLPVFRRGITATPLQANYAGEPVFLIDGSVFPGSSGSPVLICNTGGFATRGGFNISNRILFLGIISRVFYSWQDGTFELIPIPTAVAPVVKSQQMIDLGVVFKASAIVETVQCFVSSYNNQKAQN